MSSVRGLRTKLCPKCGDMTSHRTLYAKTESAGRSRWFQLFWSCAKCGLLNHVILPRYRLERASSLLPSTLATAVVNVLQEGDLDIDELIARLRSRQIPGPRHVFNSDVLMSLEYLKGRGVVAEEARDRTERTLDVLRARSSESVHLGPCPAELKIGVVRKTLISLYARRSRKLVPVGIFCLKCQYRQASAEVAKEIPLTGQQAPIAQHPYSPAD